jgi:hypothetical protein
MKRSYRISDEGRKQMEYGIKKEKARTGLYRI